MGTGISVEEGSGGDGQGEHASKAHGAVVLVAWPDAEHAAVLVDDIDAVVAVQHSAAYAHNWVLVHRLKLTIFGQADNSKGSSAKDRFHFQFTI